MSPTSTGMTASLPYVSRNGVSPVGVLVVVLYVHSMLGSSSGHIPFCPLEPSLDNFERRSVHDFNLAVSLRVGEGGVMISDPQLRAKILKEVVVELFSVV